RWRGGGGAFGGARRRRWPGGRRGWWSCRPPFPRRKHVGPRGVALDHQAHVARPKRVIQSKRVARRADVVLPAQPLKQGADGEPATTAGEELAHKRLERVEHVRVQFVERLEPFLDRRVGRVIRG